VFLFDFVAVDCPCQLAGVGRLPHAERIDPSAYR
jgi:hypothetical protein